MINVVINDKIEHIHFLLNTFCADLELNMTFSYISLGAKCDAELRPLGINLKSKLEASSKVEICDENIHLHFARGSFHKTKYTQQLFVQSQLLDLGTAFDEGDLIFTKN